MSECRWDGKAYVPSGTKIRAEITQPSEGKKINVESSIEQWSCEEGTSIP